MVRELPLRPGWRTTRPQEFNEARNARKLRADKVAALILDTLQHGETQCHFGMPGFSAQSGSWLAPPDEEDLITAQRVSEQLEATGIQILVHRPKVTEGEERLGAYIWAGNKGETQPYSMKEEIIIFSS